jgi:hypothetical protein
MKVFICAFAVLSFLFMGEGAVGRAETPETKHIVLVGASIGYAWDFGALPNRIDAKGYTFEFVGEYVFDKSKALNEILTRNPKPYAVILKECSTYFPGKFEEQKELMQTWTEALQKNGIIPILATVVPVTSPRFFTLQYVKNLIKYLPIGKIPIERRQSYVAEFNDWVRKYADEKGLAVLDLEGTLRRSEADRRLKPELTSGDGMHLNQDAYSLLDKIVVPTVIKSTAMHQDQTKIALQ